MMKTFTYFVEPASYTVDLIENIHSKLKIDYIFINDRSEAYTEINFGNDRFLSSKSLFSKIYFIYKVLKEYDIIIINGYNNYVFIFTYLFNILFFKKKHIAIESDTQLQFPKNLVKRFIKYIYLNIIFRNKYVYGFAGGSFTHKELFRYYGMNESRIFLLPMVVDNNKFYKNINHKDPEKFTFLFVGRLLSTKNVDKLCECFLSTFSDNQARLLIVGDGMNFKDYKEKYSRESVSFLGSLYGSELINIYHESSAFVFPSSQEAWGLVINEAMCSGLPIIAHRNVGSIHDLIIGKDTGFIINNDNDLKNFMLEIYHNKEIFQSFSENTVQIMKDYWNYDLYKINLMVAINKLGHNDTK